MRQRKRFLDLSKSKRYAYFIFHFFPPPFLSPGLSKCKHESIFAWNWHVCLVDVCFVCQPTESDAIGWECLGHSPGPLLTTCGSPRRHFAAQSHCYGGTGPRNSYYGCGTHLSTKCQGTLEERGLLLTGLGVHTVKSWVEREYVDQGFCLYQGWYWGA